MAEVALANIDLKSAGNINNKNSKTSKSESENFVDIFNSHLNEKNSKSQKIDESVLAEMLKMFLQGNDFNKLNIDVSQLEEGLKSLGNEMLKKMANVLNDGLSEEDLKTLLAKIKALASNKGNSKENLKNTLNNIDSNKQMAKDNSLEKAMQNVKNNNNSDSKGNLQDTVFKSAEKDSKTATNKNFAFKDLVSNLENPDKILSAKNGNEKTLGEFKQEINFDSMSRLASKTSEQNNVKTVNIDSPKDIFKITDLVEIAKNSSSKKLTVQLEPHNLGKMNIQLTEQAGKLTAKFFVENDTVKHIMVNNADQIRAQLADKGIVIHDMDFMFMDDYDSQQRFHENAERLRQQFKNGDNSGNQEEEMENEKYDRKSGIYA